ncbi:MAG: phosphoribosylglycinamide formyltransferase [Longimicrobiaceae bacterium]
MSARLAVLASGEGSTFESLARHFLALADPPARVELLVADREGANCLGRAGRLGIESVVCPPGDLPDTLASRSIDLVVLAGYLRLVPAGVVERFRGRMVNVHPALLPCFGGAGRHGVAVHQAVIDSGARVSGATVHLVDERYDAGPILAQWPVPVLPGDTAGTLARRVQRVEKVLLPAVVEALARGEAPPGRPTEPGFSLAAAPAPTPAEVMQLTAPLLSCPRPS